MQSGIQGIAAFDRLPPIKAGQSRYTLSDVPQIDRKPRNSLGISIVVATTIVSTAIQDRRENCRNRHELRKGRNPYSLRRRLASYQSRSVAGLESGGTILTNFVEVISMARYQVIVGNIGTVYDGDSVDEAERVYQEYKSQSQSKHGRAAGETVTLMECDELVAESTFVKEGDILFDMNDYHGRDNGIDTGSRGFGKFNVVPASVQIIRVQGSDGIVRMILESEGITSYMNKALIALNDESFSQDIQCIYSYDGQRFGVMTLTR